MMMMMMMMICFIAVSGGVGQIDSRWTSSADRESRLSAQVCSHI